MPAPKTKMPTPKTAQKTMTTHYPSDLVARSCTAALEAIEQGDAKRAKGILEDLAEGIYSYPQGRKAAS